MSVGETKPTAGELWARTELESLRAEGFSSKATGRFLSASALRARSNRAARPAASRRARIWLGVGAVAWIAPAAAGAEPFRRRLAPATVWWTGTAAMLIWHLGMFETESGEPRQLAAADALTLTRAWLVPLALDSPTTPVLAAGAATDVLDGVLARQVGPTRAGRDLEGLVDTCFSLGALRGLARTGRLARGPTLAEETRLIAGTALASALYFGRARAPEQRLIHAARSAGVVRFAGLLAAASGRRRLAGALLAAGTAASVILAAASLRGAQSSM